MQEIGVLYICSPRPFLEDRGLFVFVRDFLVPLQWKTAEVRAQPFPIDMGGSRCRVIPGHISTIYDSGFLP